MEETKKQPFRLQEYIKNNDFGFLITVGAVIFQAMHTQYTLKLVSSLTDVFGYNLTAYHSMGIAILISGAILYFTLRDNYKAAIGWAVFEAYMNICYYTIYINATPADDNYLYWIAIPSAFALPTILGMFAYELVKEDPKKVIQTNSIDVTEELVPVNKRIDEILRMTSVEFEHTKAYQDQSLKAVTELANKLGKTDTKLDAFLNKEFVLTNTETGNDVTVKMKIK